jgi:predicted extracellular nuclease
LRSVLLYRSDRVEAAGDAWFELEDAFTRPPLLQRFRRGSAELTVGVVHLKSKRCDGEAPLSELEGCGADTRAAEAAALPRAAARAGGGPLLLIGDYNADTREAPLTALAREGWVDLLGAVAAQDRYSYVFEARASLLDHALANAELARRAVSSSIWHINADEPSSRDYSEENPPSEYAPDARRSSDHDPISVDLRL